MRTKITIADVAKEAKVSKVTVSYVLNGHASAARISNDTKQRVIEAASQLGYRPNRIARMLATSQTDTIAVVFQHAQYFSAWSSFVSEAMRGVAASAVEEGYDLLMHTRTVSQDDEEARSLLDGHVDGVLLLRNEADPLVEEIVKSGHPAVLFFTSANNPNAYWVDADNYGGGRLAARHLLELGHTRIAMVTGPIGSVSAKERARGFRDELQPAGVNLDGRNWVRVEEPGDNLAQLIALLTQEHPPTGLFVWSDDVAFRILKLTRDLCISVPQQLSIVGFDSTNQCENSVPPLTSIQQPIFDIAQAAMRKLVRLIRNDGAVPHSTLFSPRLDVRSSTAPAPALASQHSTLT